jgi:hypothetical protein
MPHLSSKVWAEYMSTQVWAKYMYLRYITALSIDSELTGDDSVIGV